MFARLSVSQNCGFATPPTIVIVCRLPATMMMISSTSALAARRCARVVSRQIPAPDTAAAADAGRASRPPAQVAAGGQLAALTRERGCSERLEGAAAVGGGEINTGKQQAGWLAEGSVLLPSYDCVYSSRRQLATDADRGRRVGWRVRAADHHSSSGRPRFARLLCPSRQRAGAGCGGGGFDSSDEEEPRSEGKKRSSAPICANKARVHLAPVAPLSLSLSLSLRSSSRMPVSQSVGIRQQRATSRSQPCGARNSDE